MEAWTWLEGRALLAKSPSSGANWFFVGKAGKDFLKGNAGLERGEKLWRRTGTGELPLIADARMVELRALASAQFDFKKLIRLCEEINTTYREGCYFATAMLTRGLLDHVPPTFGKDTFSEVANKYAGSKSFKETMHHLENATRKVADAHLHTRIRKKETLPTAQQVHCAQQLDVLLAEIVRITR